MRGRSFQNYFPNHSKRFIFIKLFVYRLMIICLHHSNEALYKIVYVFSRHIKALTQWSALIVLLRSFKTKDPLPVEGALLFVLIDLTYRRMPIAPASCCSAICTRRRVICPPTAPVSRVAM